MHLCVNKATLLFVCRYAAQLVRPQTDITAAILEQIINPICRLEEIFFFVYFFGGLERVGHSFMSPIYDF
jgi:hypothetical protein